MPRAPIEYDQYTTDELLKMSKEEATEGLNEKQQRFCEFYIMNYNVKTSLQKAGYSAQSSAEGYILRRKPRIQRYIQWLKARVVNQALVTGADIIDQWIKIAFADLTDFVNVHRTSITLKPADEIDGQLIKAIKTGRDGISIELHDKLKALDSLAKYTEDMPKDYKQILDERRQQLLEQEYELKKKMYDLENHEGENDGFLEALKATAQQVWSDD